MYDAPEVLDEDTWGTAGDVYSFAVLAWETMTGKRPWEGASLKQIHKAVVLKEKRPHGKRWDEPMEEGEQRDPFLWEVIKGGWAQEVKDRPSFADLFASFRAASEQPQFRSTATPGIPVAPDVLMNAVWNVLREGGVSEEEIRQLKTLGWASFGITNNLGSKFRKILIKRTRKTAQEIEDDYAPRTVTSYATGNRQGLDEGGDGPGSVWNFLVCLAMDIMDTAGRGMSMTGMLSAQGDFYGTYMKCVDKDIAKALKIPLADYMVVLLSKAFTQSGMCMVEVFTAIKSGIQLVLVNVEEPLDWGNAWPLEQTLTRYPFEGGKLRCCMLIFMLAVVVRNLLLLLLCSAILKLTVLLLAGAKPTLPSTARSSSTD